MSKQEREIKPGSRLRRRRLIDGLRAAVVALATLAILLVCFSIYQNSQLDTDKPAQFTPPRVPTLPDDPSFADRAPGEDLPSINIGGVPITGGRDIKLSFFRRGEDSPRGEVAFLEWEPVPGASDECLLREPEFRMRTSDDHGLRVTADRALLEALRRPGLEIRRGKLSGGVLIEYDRLTRAEREALPPDEREISPDQLVQIRTEELFFDVEYSKLNVPGRLQLEAPDVSFETTGFEMRFDESQGRVEYVRIDQGGRLELRQADENLNVGLGGDTAEQQTRRRSLVQWLKETVQARILAVEQQKAEEALAQAAPPEVERPEIYVDEEGVTVFRLNRPTRKLPPRDARYYARMEDEIEVQQLDGAETTRLSADLLEIVRVVSADDRERLQTSPSETPREPDQQVEQGPDPATSTILTWKGRLSVELCGLDDPQCAGVVHSRIRAEGSPVLLAGPRGRAECSALLFEPDQATVRLEEGESGPVVVHSASGSVTGRSLRWREAPDSFELQVVGPGQFQQSGESVLLATGDAGPADDAGQATIAFAESLTAKGRPTSRREVEWQSMQIVERQCRGIDTADFVGGVRLRNRDVAVDAGRMTAHFAPPDRRCDPVIREVLARGGVTLQQGEDHLTGGEMDLQLGRDFDGAIIPLTASLRHDVNGMRKQHRIEARDELLVDFEMIERPPTRADLGQAATGPGTTAWQTALASTNRREVSLHRVQARGGVAITGESTEATAGQGDELDLHAEKLDALLSEGKLDRALLFGDENDPAAIAVERGSLTGREIRMDARTQRAEVPGPGRATFRSESDLVGNAAERPVPVSVTWSRRMRLGMQENIAVFSGDVHVASAATADEPRVVTFDSDELTMTLEDAEPGPTEWWPFHGVVDRLNDSDNGDDLEVTGAFQSNKQIRHLLAKGRSVVNTEERDPGSGELLNRARLEGPRLSLDLRPEISKMHIEGRGSLLLEQFSPPSKDVPPASLARQEPPTGPDGLLTAGMSSGPSTTLVTWDEFMSHDMTLNQTRFEGKVELKHFSGQELERAMSGADLARSPGAGRRTFLTCDVLTADFMGDADDADRGDESGRQLDLASANLRQFRAAGNVSLSDEVEGLYVSCSDLIFERERQILFVQGSPGRKARITLQPPGKAPRHYEFARCVYDLEQNVIEASDASFHGQ